MYNCYKKKKNHVFFLKSWIIRAEDSLLSSCKTMQSGVKQNKNVSGDNYIPDTEPRAYYIIFI